LEEQADSIANITYTHPTDDGGVAVESDAATSVATAMADAGEVPRVGRNDPCPCGSGKKYKSCHGKLA
jgi:preprotein translocase subunit SecA